MSKQKKRLGRKAQRIQDFTSVLTPLTEAFATSRGVNRDSLPTQQAAKNLANIQNEERQDQRRLDFLRSTNELNEEFQQRKLDQNIERFESRFGVQDSAQPQPTLDSAQPQPTLFSRPRGRVLGVAQEPLRMIDGEEAEVDSSFLPPSVAEVGSYPAFDISDAQGQKNYIDAERDNLRYIKRQQLTDEGVKQVQRRESALASIEQNRPGQQSEALSQYQDYVSKSSLMDEVVKTPTIDEEIQNGVNIHVTEDGTFLRKPDGTYSANYKPQALQQQMTGDLIRSQTELTKQANDNEAKNRQSTTDNIKELYGSVANFRKQVSSRVEQELKNAGLTRSQVSQEALDEVSRQVEQGLVQEANASTLTGSSEESPSNFLSPKEVDGIASAYGLDLSIREDEEKLANIASQLYPDKEYVSLAGPSGGDDSSQVISEMRPEDAYIKFNEGEDTSDNGASYARRTDQTLRMFHPMISIGDIYGKLNSQIKQMAEGTEDPVSTAKKMRYAVDPFVITRLDLQRATPDPKTGKRPSDEDGLQAIEVYFKAYNKHRETGQQHIGYVIPITRSAMLKRGLYISGDKERDLEMIRSIPVGQKYFDTDGTIYTKKMKKPLIPKPKGPLKSFGGGIGTMGM